MTKSYLIASTDPLQLIDYCLAELAKFSQGIDSRLSEHSFIIVPEALKADIERRYLANYDVNGLMLAEVLSFNRLAHRIFSIVGGLASETISSLGKTLLLQRLLHQKKDQFKRFQRFAGKPGYTSELEKILSDFKRFDIDNKTLSELVELTPPSLTKDKFSDFSKLQSLYQDNLEQLNMLDQDDNLDRLATLLEKNKNFKTNSDHNLEFLSETRIWITGFADIRSFNQQELKIMKLLSQQAKELRITICTDLTAPGRIRRELLEPGYQSFQQIKKILPKAELIVLPSVTTFTQQVIQDSFLTGRITEEKAQNTALNDEEIQITLIAADDKRQEWSFIAGEIKRLLQEENIRKKDIGIAICDDILDLSLEKSTFREFGLDTFLSQRLPIRQTPLYRYLEGYFNLANQAFNLNDLLSFFRSGLAQAKQEEIDEFENICLEYGIKFASEIQSDKTYQRICDKEKRVLALEFKSIHLDPIISSIKELRSIGPGNKKAQFLLKWLARNTFKNKLQENISNLQAWGESDIALSLARSWEIILQLLEESRILLGDSRISQRAFSEIILGALSGQVPSAIPIGLDRIRVGSMLEMMYYDCKILFITGTSQNTFPPSKASEGFLHKTELEWLEAKSGKSLPDYRQNQMIAGQVSSMLLFSGKKEKIYFSTPYIDQTEWSNLFNLFKNELDRKTSFAKAIKLKSYTLGDKLQPDQRWLTRQRTLRYLKADQQTNFKKADKEISLTKIQSSYPEINQKSTLPQSKTYWYQAVKKIEEAQEISDTKRKIDALSFLAQESTDLLDRIRPHIYLSESLNSSILENKHYVSASSLEKFQACPYQYFNDYSLALRERPVWEVDPRDRGRLIHSMMELALSDLQAELKFVQNEKARESLFSDWFKKIRDKNFYDQLYERSILATGVAGYSDEIVAVKQGERIKRHIRTALHYNIEKISKEDFLPLSFEWVFPPSVKERSNYQELNLAEQGEKIALRGLIDRIDQNPQGKYRLYDYKTGKKTVDIDRIFQGLDLQLGLYQKIWQLNHPDQLADSIGYLLFENSLSDNKKSFSPPTTDLSTRLKEYKLFKTIEATSEEIEAIGMHATEQAKKAILQIKAGKISPIPQSFKIKELPCRYCQYKEMCRYDQRLISQRANILGKLQIPVKTKTDKESTDSNKATREKTFVVKTKDASKEETLRNITETYIKENK